MLELEWRQLRNLEGQVVDKHLKPYITDELPIGVMNLAISDSLPEDIPDALDKKMLFERLFLPWFLFNWIAEEDFEVDGNQFDPSITVSMNYLKTHKNNLTEQEKRFIETINKSYYSFYSVLRVERDRALIVKDILLGTTHRLKERQGTHCLRRGDIVYSRILTLNDQSIFVGMAPMTIPVDFHNKLLDFKDWLIEENDGKKLTGKKLRQDFDLDLLDYFFDIMEAAYNRPSPILSNTDGDQLQFSKSHFKLTMSAEETLKRLLPMTLSDDTEPFLCEAKRSESGEIKSIDFPWLKKGNKKHKEWNNTVLGEITIEPGKLILETNSEKRMQKGKKLLIKYLGDNLLFQKTLIESVEQKLQSISKFEQNDKTEDNLLMEQPEIREKLKAMAEKHWQNWFDELIPALENQPPRQAAKTKQDRDRLEALLMLYERHDLEKGDHPLKADINYLKSELGMDKGL